MTWIWETDNVLVTSFLMHILPHHSFPLGKRYGYYKLNLYLSPFLSFTFGFLWNSVNSQLSANLEGEHLLDVDSLSHDWLGSCIDKGNE